MIFGKHINRYYLKNAPVLILGVLALILVTSSSGYRSFIVCLLTA